MNVGDYVRTKDGRIFKWNKLCTTDIEDWMEHTRKILFIEDEIKSSPNIIDLIEVGDYVNGLEVVEFDEKYNCFICECCGMECGEEWIYDNEDIKSIVTKEQFSQMEYKVGVSDEC